MDTSLQHASAWWFLDTLVVVHREAAGRGSIVLEMTLPEGSAPPLHVHHSYDDSEYLLDGQMVVERAGELSMAGVGDWLSVPRDVPHRFRVVGGRPADLIVHDVSSFLELIYAVGDPAERRTLPPPVAAPTPTPSSKRSPCTTSHRSVRLSPKTKPSPSRHATVRAAAYRFVVSADAAVLSAE
jgi:mannose-6-phosphate isomerase-like protein (cupin superfamily)